MQTKSRLFLFSLLAAAWLVTTGCGTESASCPDGETACGSQCIDTLSDPSHCGGCGQACGTGELCMEGVCGCPDGLDVCDPADADLYALCFQGGQARPFLRDHDARVGPAFSGMEGPQAMALLGDEHLVVVGSIDQTLHVIERKTMRSVGSLTLAKDMGPTMPNDLVVDGDRAYVVATGTNEVVAVDLRNKKAPQVAYAVSTGESSSPMAATLDDEGRLWVTLWMGHGLLPIEAAEGKALDTLSVAPEGIEGAPYPAGVVASGGKIYVSLNNLGEDFAPAGNGRLWSLTPSTQEVELIDLGADCKNPGLLVAHDGKIFVPCTGTYTGDGAVAIHDPSQGDTTTLPTGGAPARLSLSPAAPTTLFVADSMGLDVLRLDLTTGDVQAIRACSEQDWEFVADVLAVP